jgi:hypothetical protein
MKHLLATVRELTGILFTLVMAAVTADVGSGVLTAWGHRTDHLTANVT